MTTTKVKKTEIEDPLAQKALLTTKHNTEVIFVHINQKTEQKKVTKKKLKAKETELTTLRVLRDSDYVDDKGELKPVIDKKFSLKLVKNDV